MTLTGEVKESIETLWRQIVGEDDEAAALAAMDTSNRKSGILLLLYFAACCLVVYMPFFVMIWTINRRHKAITTSQRERSLSQDVSVRAKSPSNEKENNNADV